jgi:ATP-dependent DNA helicase RecQ
MTIHEILKEYWGYDSFRPLQEELIRSVLEGHDTLGLLPTGGGKSITFQVPALALGGLCLVVTPLISLMKDQTDHLVERGIKAAYLHMGLSHQEIVNIYDRVTDEHYNFLYLSPERLSSQLFQARLFYMDVRMVVVDEAHCISQWGYDFRPSYLKIAELRHMLRQPHVPCMALTATATTQTIDDIARRLEFREGYKVFRASFVRPNLTYTVQFVDNAASKIDAAVGLLREVECGIVYVRSREKTEVIARALTQAGVSASFYHAGLTPNIRQKRQDAWIRGEVRVMVATNAFGMGIDKPNVRLVVHLGLDPSPEEYFQEAGRAGRDLQPARAVLLADPQDGKTLLKNLAHEFPDREFIRYVYERLASYFQVAIGAGLNSTFDYNEYQFAKNFHLPPTETFHALHYLEQAGYIQLRDASDSFSSVHITMPRQQLYLVKLSREADMTLNTLLRLYTGLFADYEPIQEEKIAFYWNGEQEQVYQALLELRRKGVLDYRPKRKVPTITYMTPRLELSEVLIPRAIYEEKYARMRKRVDAMIMYLENDGECRLRQLLHYFGEEITEDCGRCDVCRRRQQDADTADPDRRAAIRRVIEELRAAHPDYTVDDLCQHAPDYRPTEIAEELRRMTEERTEA